MARVIDGVLIPAEMDDATPEELREYARNVKSGNAAFIRAYFKLEDELAKHGLTMQDIGVGG